MELYCESCFTEYFKLIANKTGFLTLRAKSAWNNEGGIMRLMISSDDLPEHGFFCWDSLMIDGNCLKMIL